MPDAHNRSGLSSGDALFLYLEREGQPIHVAAVGVFEGVIPLEACREFIHGKLALMPLGRQRLVVPAFHVDLPAWECDPRFELQSHIREENLKRGTDVEFRTAASRILSRTMDRTRPLWDFTLIQGLRGKRTGLVMRFHHSMMDGVSAVELLGTILDRSPNPPPIAKPEPVAATPVQETRTALVDSLIGSISTIQRVLAAESELLDLAKQVAVAEGSQVSGEAHPREGASPSAPVLSLDALKKLLAELATTAERLPFNTVCRGPQAFRWTTIPMDAIQAVRQRCGATVNDILLALVTLAVRHYAEQHAIALQGRQLRIVVPVSLRQDGERGATGNRISFLPIGIPLDIAEPEVLLAAARQAAEHAKSMRLTELVSLLGTLLASIPTTIQALLGPIVSQLPLNLCNMICTNLAGPEESLYLLGHKLLACYPYVPVGGEMGMNCAFLSYNGTGYLGLTGDVHAIPDLQRLAAAVLTSFEELCRTVGLAPEPGRQTRKRRTTPKATTESKPTGEKAFRARAGN